MEKEKVLMELSAAKKSHIKWVNRAKSLVEGLPVDKDAIPLDSTECQFGAWFYSEGEKLHLFPNMDCLSMIETLHFHLHDSYLSIFKLYFGEDKRSFLGKLFNARKKVSESEKELAYQYFLKLEEYSTQLLGEITKLERRLNAIPMGSFEMK